MLAKTFLSLVIAAVNISKKVIKIIILPQVFPLLQEGVEPPFEKIQLVGDYLLAHN